MNKQEKMQYINKKPVAVYGLSNTTGIEILDVLYGIEDYIVYRFSCIDIEPSVADIHISKVHYGVTKTTFRAGRLTIDLGQCIRV